ncbi:unknown [Bacteroides sp. CAG:1060]|nr:unknown [Bacteroides sp. CAG:1060]
MLAQGRVCLAVREHDESEFYEFFRGLQSLYGVRKEVSWVRVNLKFEPVGAECLTCHLGGEYRFFSISYSGSVGQQLDARMCYMLEHVVFLILQLYALHRQSDHFCP